MLKQRVSCPAYLSKNLRMAGALGQEHGKGTNSAGRSCESRPGHCCSFCVSILPHIRVTIGVCRPATVSQSRFTSGKQ
jgi:hypothetical protein